MSPAPVSVSVILPVFNGERFLAEAVDSVLAQEYEPLEIVVVDDGSTDGTAEVARGYGDRIRYCYQKNAGPAAARNQGLRLASGDVMAFIDADDLWPRGKLALQVGRLQQDPDLEVVTGRVQYAVLTRGADGEMTFAPFQAPAVGVNVGAGIYRRAVFEKLGYFNPAYQSAEDVDLFMRIREQRIPMVVLDEVTLIYRIHNTNMTRERESRESVFLRALKQSLDRRRTTGNQPSGELPAIKKESERKSQ